MTGSLMSDPLDLTVPIEPTVEPVMFDLLAAECHLTPGELCGVAPVADLALTTPAPSSGLRVGPWLSAAVAR